MPSTNKTEHLGLNAWEPEDCPKRADFNADNEIVDAALAGHMGDDARHVTAALLAQIANAGGGGAGGLQLDITTYTGDGASSQTVTLAHEPRFAAVFCLASRTLCAYDPDEDCTFVRFGLAVQGGATKGSKGMALNGAVLTVRNALLPIDGARWELNDYDISYCIISFW